MPGTDRRWRDRRDLLRRHWVFGAVLALAAALRAVVLWAYRPALIFPDSARYLEFAQRFADGHWTPDTIRPSGYSILLVPAVAGHVLALIPLAQHLLGLAEGVLVYAVLVRLGGRRWLATIAAVPVLFDPLQLDLDQYVLSDACAAFFLIAALVVLVWNGKRTGAAATAAAGLLLGAAAVTRVADVALIVPAAAYLAVAVRPWRRLAVRCGVLAGGFLLPVIAYAGWFGATHGQFGLTGYNGTFLYGRVVQFADCAGMRLPADERALCPAQPPAQRDPDFYTWSPRSPQWEFTPPPGRTRQSVVLDFSLRVLAHQPGSYLGVVARDIGYGFSPVRGDGPEHYPVAYLQFQPRFPPYAEDSALRTYGGSGPVVQPGLTAFLTGYGRFCYVPGPVMAAGLLLGLAGLAGTRRSRRSGLRPACLLFTAGAAAALVSAAAFAPFDWRYQLPQLTLIPVAAVLGASALSGRRASGRPEPDVPLIGSGPPEDRPRRLPQDLKVENERPVLDVPEV